MSAAFAVPLMSTVDSSQHVRNHNHTHSHQRSGRRLSRPFILPRIPSERLDPRSVNYFKHSQAASDSHDSHDNTNRTSFRTNGSISAPSLSKEAHLKGISKRTESAKREIKPNGSMPSKDYGFPSFDSKVDRSGKGMASKMR
jgi:hypothetical protein